MALPSLIILVLVFLSCKNGVTTTDEAKEALLIDTLQPALIENTDQRIKTDTIERLVVDDFPVTDDMFGMGTNGREIKSGEVRSLDKVWFSNDTIKQTLVYELYTDYHRLATFLFSNDNVPKDLIQRMELHAVDGDTASQQQKEKYFTGLIGSSKRISQNYFTTIKRFRLGDKKQKAINIYGKPNKTIKRDNVELYEWHFIGDILYEGKEDLKGKPLAKDNYGHQVIMFFRNDKLIGIIFHNDIP